MLNDVGGISNATDGDRPRLVSIVALDTADDSSLLTLAASAACGLEPSVAAAIVESAHGRGVQVRGVEQFRRRTPAGVVATAGGHAVVVGNAALFSGLRLSVENLGDWPERLQRRGEAVLFVAIDSRTAGILGFTKDANR